MNNYDYPLGADNESAPWNERDAKKEHKRVFITISKVIEVEEGCNLPPDEMLERYNDENDLNKWDIEEYYVEDE